MPVVQITYDFPVAIAKGLMTGGCERARHRAPLLLGRVRPRPERMIRDLPAGDIRPSRGGTAGGRRRPALCAGHIEPKFSLPISRTTRPTIQPGPPPAQVWNYPSHEDASEACLTNPTANCGTWGSTSSCSIPRTLDYRPISRGQLARLLCPGFSIEPTCWTSCGLSPNRDTSLVSRSS